MRRRKLSHKRIYALICHDNGEYSMMKKRIYIGRTCLVGSPDVQLVASNFISRRHIELIWGKGELYLRCLGKNGVFINEHFKPSESILYRLPKCCSVRFPNTGVKIKIRRLLRGGDEVKFPVGVVNGQAGVADSRPGGNRRKQQLKATPRCLSSNYAKQANTSDIPITPENSSAAIKVLNGAESRDTLIWDVPVSASGGLVLESSTSVQLIDALSISTANVSRNVAKPPFSFAQLIVQAVASQPSRRLTLAGIYNFINRNYPYYQLHDKGWQNSIRHNLSLNRYFFKAPRNPEEPGKGCFWRIDPQFEERLISQAFRRRRPRTGSDQLTPEIFSVLPMGTRFVPLVRPWCFGPADVNSSASVKSVSISAIPRIATSVGPDKHEGSHGFQLASPQTPQQQISNVSPGATKVIYVLKGGIMSRQPNLVSLV